MNFLKTYEILEKFENANEQNRNYIHEHKSNVSKFANWLKENLPMLFDNVNSEEFDLIINEHDASKYSKEEFEPYAQKWFGDGIKTPEYEAAWEHHWKTNKHHPEYWAGEDMEYIYILEMICDWGSFGIKKNDMHELSDFYYNKAKDDKEKNLSENTKAEIEKIINAIESILSDHKESLTEAVEILPKKLYHATYKPFLKSIQQKGLGNTKIKMWSDSVGGVVYLANDPDIAESYAETAEWVDTVENPDTYLDNIVIFEIDTSKLDKNKLKVDKNVLLDEGEENATWEYHGIIPWEVCSIFNH